MRKLFLLLFLLYTVLGITQTMTERYNSLMNRHEYYNSSGSLIGYKSYDSLMQTWNYYDVSEQQKNEQIQNTYIEPININLVNQALASKQARYTSNTSKIQSAINDIADKLNNLKLESHMLEIVKLAFDQAIKDINKQNRDYSKNQVTQDVVNYLYNQVNNEIAFQLQKDEDFKKASLKKWNSNLKQNQTPTSDKTNQMEAERKKAMEELATFYGGYKTNLVTEEIYNARNPKSYDIISEDKATTKFYFQNSHLFFLRAQNNQWLVSEWVWFVTKTNFYILFDDYNQMITINKDFKTVTFYANKVGDNYTKRFVYHNLTKDTSVIPN